jgi:acyl-CoA carboxylase subunit beta
MRADRPMRRDRPADGDRPGPLYCEVADPGSLIPFGEEAQAGNPNGWPGYVNLLRRARLVAGARHAVTTGLARVGGHPCVLVGFEYAFLGGSLGVAEGARIAQAFATATARRLPVVSVTASGGARMQEGTSALVQMQVIAAAIGAARDAGVPHVAVAGDPTTGGVWASLAAGADVLFGVAGARISFSGTRTRPAGTDPAAAEFSAADQWRHGLLDALVQPAELRERVAVILGLLSPGSRGADNGPGPALGLGDGADGLGDGTRGLGDGALASGRPGAPAERHLAREQDTRGEQDTPGPGVPGVPGGPGASGGPAAAGADVWAHISAARDRHGAPADRWLAACFQTTFEIRGDRCGGIDAGLRCGFGARDGVTTGYIAQTGQPITPAGLRTATRLLTLAGRFRRPVLTLIDTPGASATPGDEAAGLGNALAELLVLLAGAKVPVTSVVIGEGVSGGAIALAAPDRLWLAPDGYLAVIAPEYATSILKLPASAVRQVAARLRLRPADLIGRGLARGLAEPPGPPGECR